MIDNEVAAQQELEEARRLLAASADSMLDPQMLLEGVRDPAGRVVDLIPRGQRGSLPGHGDGQG